MERNKHRTLLSINCLSPIQPHITSINRIIQTRSTPILIAGTTLRIWILRNCFISQKPSKPVTWICASVYDKTQYNHNHLHTTCIDTPEYTPALVNRCVWNVNSPHNSPKQTFKNAPNADALPRLSRNINKWEIHKTNSITSLRENSLRTLTTLIYWNTHLLRETSK